MTYKLSKHMRDALAEHQIPVELLEREMASEPRKLSPRKTTFAGAKGGDGLVSALYGLTPEVKALGQAAAK